MRTTHTLLEELRAEFGGCGSVHQFHLECLGIQHHQQVDACFGNRSLELRIGCGSVGVTGQHRIGGEVCGTPLAIGVQFADINVGTGRNAALVRSKRQLGIGTTNGLQPGAALLGCGAPTGSTKPSTTEMKEPAEPGWAT